MFLHDENNVNSARGSHCEERSDEAISFLRGEIAALPMVARNDSLLQLAVIVLSKNKRVGMAYP
jgi:hypothetical protein